jgi:hypothetical protein
MSSGAQFLMCRHFGRQSLISPTKRRSTSDGGSWQYKKEEEESHVPSTHRKKRRQGGGLMMDVIQSDSSLSLLSHPLLYIHSRHPLLLLLLSTRLSCWLKGYTHKTRIEEEELVAVSCLSTTRTTSFIQSGWLRVRSVYGREKEGGLTALLHDTLNYHSSSGTHTQKSRDDNKRRASRFQLSLFPQHIFLLYKDTVSCFVLYFFCIFVFCFFLRAI